MDDRIEKAVQRRLAEFEQQKITPMTAKQHEAHLNTLADQMTEKYGTEWSEQSATMQRIAEETFSQEKQLNITLEDVEDLYIASLRRDGKLQSFLKSQDRQKGERVVNKSTGRPKATQTHKPAKRPKTIIEAAIIASKKHKTAF